MEEASLLTREWHAASGEGFQHIYTLKISSDSRIFKKGRERLNKIKDIRKRLAELDEKANTNLRRDLECQLPSESESEAMEESPMVMFHDRVTSNDIS